MHVKIPTWWLKSVIGEGHVYRDDVSPNERLLAGHLRHAFSSFRKCFYFFIFFLSVWHGLLCGVACGHFETGGDNALCFFSVLEMLSGDFF